MAERLEHIARVVRRRSLRRMLLAFGMFSIAENATWLAVTVFAFQRGGVAEAGLVAVVQLAPAVVVAPFAAYAGDRFRKDVVLMAGYAVQAATMLATALAMASGASAPIVYGAATAAAVAVTFTGPGGRAALRRRGGARVRRHGRDDAAGDGVGVAPAPRSCHRRPRRRRRRR
jgi:MFS family permease